MPNYTMQILWLVLLVVFAVAEAVTVALVSVWFCTGAVAALLVSFFVPSPGVQAAVFFVVSALVLVLLRPYAQKRLATKRVATNADALVGKTGRLLCDLTPPALGRVRVDDVDWNARCQTPLKTGTLVRVAALTGTTLTVEPLPEE